MKNYHKDGAQPTLSLSYCNILYLLLTSLNYSIISEQNYKHHTHFTHL